MLTVKLIEGCFDNWTDTAEYEFCPDFQAVEVLFIWIMVDNI